MSPLERKILVLRSRHRTISNLARAFSGILRREVRREEVSMCLRGVREYPVLQDLLADEFGINVEQLFPSRRKKAA
jgi:hypothetical protein